MIFSHVEFDHESLHFCHDPKTGLRAIIAIHSSTLGPAAGGCRMYPYASEEDAVTDVLRLSRGMTYKSALAGLELGGGKSVIIGNPRTDKSPELMEAFGRFIDQLGGRYYAAEDSGTSTADIEAMGRSTRYVFGRSGGGSGDPSAFTAEGVFVGMKACAEAAFGSDDLSGKTVAIQGVGNVGAHLARFVRAAGAELKIADINPEAAAEVASEVGAEVIELREILETKCDILAPCAIGAILNEVSIPKIQAEVVCGAANNQLAVSEDGERLRERGILYGPDFVVNAGGILNAAGDIFGDYDVEDVHRRIAGIREVMLDIAARSKAEGRPTNQIADAMAREKIGH